MPQTNEDLNTTVRKELSKWVDAKLLFQQFTHGRDGKTKSIHLDDYWKKSFAMVKSSNHLYKRYFNSLDRQNKHEWSEDFDILLKKFQNFCKSTVILRLTFYN